MIPSTLYSHDFIKKNYTNYYFFVLIFLIIFNDLSKTALFIATFTIIIYLFYNSTIFFSDLFSSHKKLKIYIIVFITSLIFLSFINEYIVEPLEIHYIKLSTSIKAFIYFIFGLVLTKKLNKSHLFYLLIIFTFLNIINLIIFTYQEYGLNSSLEKILSTFVNFLKSFSKLQTSVRGHFPYYNSTTYKIFLFINLCICLFYFDFSLKILIIVFIATLKIFSFFDISSIILTIIIFSFYFIKIKFNLKKTITYIFILFLAFSTIHSLQILKDRLKNEKSTFSISNRYQIYFDQSDFGILKNHKIIHRYNEFLSIYNCGKLKKIFQDQIQYIKFNDCLIKNNITNADGGLFYHNIYLNILLISNIYILILYLLLGFIIFYYSFIEVKKNKKNIKNFTYLIIVFTFITLDINVVLSNFFFIYLGYNFRQEFN